MRVAVVEIEPSGFAFAIYDTTSWPLELSQEARRLNLSGRATVSFFNEVPGGYELARRVTCVV